MSTLGKMASFIEGKVAVITGGTGGLGIAFAEALLDRGAKVCVADINTTSGAQTENELRSRYDRDRVFFRKCDVTSEQEFEDTLKETVSRYGRLDILCNNAGIGNEKNWQLMMDINLTAVIRGTLLAFKYMGKAAGNTDGLVINTSSAAGVLPMPFGPMYTASKHGVVGLTRSIGILSPKLFGVRVNCICPSFANTPIMDFNEDASFGVNPKKWAEQMINMVGVMQPREVAESLVNLAEMTDTSGAVMLVTPSGKHLLHMPITIEEMFAKHSKI